MKKVYFIDDDAAIRDAYQIVFERAGYDIRIHEDGSQIIDMEFEEPDIFIIDKQLNGTDGLDICRYLKKRIVHNSTPVIIFSASPRVKEMAIEAGADDFLEKPFKTKTLIELVNRYLEKAVYRNIITKKSNQDEQ